MIDRPSTHWNGSRNGSGPNSPDHTLFHPGHLKQFMPPIGSPIEPVQTSGLNPNGISKPRIWSLADLASKESKDDAPSSAHPFHSGPGKIMAPLTGRGLHPMHHPYMRPELYRGFYGPPAAHMTNTTPDALLESYQRTFGNHNGIINSVPLKFSGTSFSTSGIKDVTLTNLPAKSSPRSVRSSASSSPEHNNSNDKIANN